MGQSSMTDQGSKARRHHYISACYLKNFAAPRHRYKGRLWALDKNGKKQWPSTPNGVGYERDFNRIEADGLHPNLIEDMLGETIEAEFPKVISYVERTRRLPKPNGELYGILITMVALFAIRHPSMRDKVEDFYRRTDKLRSEADLNTDVFRKQTVQRMKDEGLQDPEYVYDAVRSRTLDGGYEIEFPTGFHIKAEFDAQKTIFPFLYDRKWELLVHDGDAEFITSSAPINLIATTPTRAGMPLGFGLTKTAATFTLTPKLCAFGTFEGRFRTRKVAADEVEEINGIIARSACRFIYSRQETFSFLTLDGYQTQAKLLRTPNQNETPA